MISRTIATIAATTSTRLTRPNSASPVDLLGQTVAEVHRLHLLGPERREARGQPVDHELRHLLRLVDVLQVDGAELALRDAVGERARDERGRRRRQEHLTAVAGGADPRRTVHVDPDVALLPDDRLSRVEAHPDAQVCPVGPLVRGERLLRRDRGRDGVAGALEAEEERVALRVDLLTATGGELVADQAPVLREHLGVPVSEPLQELRRAGDVREDEGDRAAAEHVRR